MARALEFHPEALQEAVAAADWYSRKSREAARQFVRELEEAVRAIATAPDRYPTWIAASRRALLKRFPYSVVYYTRPEVIQIMAVAHSRRRPGYWERRLG